MSDTHRPAYRFDDREIDWKPFRGFEGLDYRVMKVDHERG